MVKELEKQTRQRIYDATPLEFATYGIAFLHAAGDKDLSWLATALAFQDEDDLESLEKGFNNLKELFPDERQTNS